MKTELKQLSVLAIALVLCPGITLGHKQVLHRRITETAADSALSLGTAYSGFLSAVSSDISTEDAKKYLSDGSFHEDDMYEDNGGIRSFNHFYDPLTGQGLSNIPIDDRISPYGKNLFAWASTRDCPGINFLGCPSLGLGINVNTYNEWSWQNARDKEWLGLTARTPSSRQAALLDMFRAVGQVVHLVEDASQPEHTRNEQHGVPGSPIEKYGGEHLANLNFQHGMLDWRGLGFTKLQDFWDRDLYQGDGSALAGDAGNGAKLGLAEFSNGNFLGGRHLYPEYFNQDDVQYYPLPSRDRSTNYKQVAANPSLGIDTYIIGNREVRGIYIKKTGDGIPVNHLSFDGSSLVGRHSSIHVSSVGMRD